MPRPLGAITAAAATTVAAVIAVWAKSVEAGSEHAPSRSRGRTGGQRAQTAGQALPKKATM